jgi:hypothetical protein
VTHRLIRFTTALAVVAVADGKRRLSPVLDRGQSLGMYGVAAHGRCAEQGFGVVCPSPSHAIARVDVDHAGRESPGLGIIERER